MLPKRKPTSKFGAVAEDYAVKLLENSGYKVIDRNFYSKFGEIDIVALENKDTLVFVEVKARWSNKFGAPEEAVTPQKLWKIKKTGEYYSSKHPGMPRKLRIDVVALILSGGRVVSSKIIRVGC